MTRNRILAILGAIVLIGGGAIAVRARQNGGFAFGPGAGQTADQVTDGDIVTAFIGDLSATASATGQYLPQDEASLSLGISGEITELLVREGQFVSNGDPLLRINSLALERAVINAEQQLIIQQANLSQLLEPPNQEDIVSAEAAVLSARANLDELLDGADDTDIAAQEEAIKSAQASLWSAQAGYISASETASDSEIQAARASLNAANAAVQAAQQRLNDVMDGASQQEISSAEANLRSAEASVANARESLETLQAGAGEAQIANAQASLTNAQQQQRAAQDAYDNAYTCYEQDGGYIYCPNEPLQEGAALQLDIANQNLAAAQATLNDLLKGADPNSVAAAQNQLNSAIAQRDAAQAALNDVLAGASDAAVADARSSLNSAISQRDNAQSTLDRLLEPPDQAQLASASASIAASRANLASAEAQLENLLTGSSSSQLEQARASVASAEAQLANLRRAASETSIAIAEANVRQAEINLEEARENLAKATLTAPFDGIVTDVLVTQGEVAGGVVMNLVNFETLAVLVDVDEIDLGELSVGQEAIVTFDAYPNLELTATVESIATTATTNTGSEIVTFEVRLAVDAPDDVDLRIGMTANANLVTARRENVLLVPNEAITVDRSRGTFTVSIVEGEGEDRTITEVQIGTGLRDSDFTQVTDGLEEGQQLLVGDFSAPTFEFGGGPPGGGGN